jgi:hypothetical protein
MEQVYWSVQVCGWVASPAAPDALATPWSRSGVPLRDVPRPVDAADVLRLRRDSAAVPAPRRSPALDGLPAVLRY